MKSCKLLKYTQDPAIAKTDIGSSQVATSTNDLANEQLAISPTRSQTFDKNRCTKAGKKDVSCLDYLLYLSLLLGI